MGLGVIYRMMVGGSQMKKKKIDFYYRVNLKLGLLYE